MNSNQFSPDMSLEKREKKLVEMSDENIDFSDIPELDEAFLKNVKLVKKQRLRNNRRHKEITPC